MFLNNDIKNEFEFKFFPQSIMTLKKKTKVEKTILK